MTQIISAVDHWPDPRPLPTGLPPVMALDEALLPAPLFAWAVDIAERMQCPLDYIAVTAMVSAATLIGRKVALRPKQQDDWSVVCNLWALCVGRPSLMKTPAMREGAAFLTRLEAQAAQQHAQAVNHAKATSIIAEVSRKVKTQELTRTVRTGGDAQALAATMVEQEGDIPRRRRYLVNNTTVEKLGIILSENPNGLAMFCDEAIGLLKSMEREGHEADRSFYLTAWNGDSRFTYDRVGRGTVDIEAPCVSFIGGIQPGVLQDYLRQAVSGGRSDDGLMQRFQLAVWPDQPRSWLNVDRQPNPADRIRAFAAFQHLADLSAGDVQAQRDPHNDQALPFLRFTADAQGLFEQWREALERSLIGGKDHPAIEAHRTKYRSLIPSLALIIHLTEGRSGPVGHGALLRAIGWGQYLESHARRLYASVTHSINLSAKELARRIQEGEITDGFTGRDVYRNNWTGLGKAETQDAVECLVALDWLAEQAQENFGRPRIGYVINPKIRDMPRE